MTRHTGLRNAPWTDYALFRAIWQSFFATMARQPTSSRCCPMKSLRGLILLAFLSLGATPWTAAHAAPTLDTVPRTAVMSAFEPEWTALQTMLVGRKDYVIDGTTFAPGTIATKPVG